MAILLALPGQLALIVSFLLPIKILMLMASNGMPSFMPGLAQEIDKKDLITILAFLSMAAFVFHHISNKAILSIAKSGASKIQKRHQKLHLFEGQEELLSAAYARYIDTVASVNFIILGTAALFFIYPEVALLFSAYLTISSITIGTLMKKKRSDLESFIQATQKKLPMLSGIGFFLIFACVLIDYLFFEIPQNFIILIVSVILGRQLLVRTNIITKALFFFSLQKNKLNALLFHQTAFHQDAEKKHPFWDFIDPNTNSFNQLQKVLQSIENTSEGNATLCWQDTGIQGVAFITATFPKLARTYLVKIFGKKRRGEARHEATLLLDPPQALPSPSLSHETIIDGNTIIILDISDSSFPIPPCQKKDKDFLSWQLTQVIPPKDLISKYVRSRTMIWDGIRESDIRKTLLVAKHPEIVHVFIDQLPKLRSELRKFPLRIHNPQIFNARVLAKTNTGELQCLHWGRWTLEPLGMSISLTSSNQQPGQQQLICGEIKLDLRDHNNHLIDPTPVHLSNKLVKQLRQQLFLESVATMKELNELFT